MKIYKALRAMLLAPVLLGGAMLAAAQAQDYPSGTIRLVVPFAPGASTDAFARVMADEFNKATGATVVVENKPGANGLLAGDEVARSKPDGYTLLLATSSTHSAAPFIFKDVPYDPIKDFSPIALLITGQNILVVTPTIPVNSVSELIDFVKGRPGELKYGTHNSSTLVAMEVLKARTGMDVVQVRYKNIADNVNDLVAGRTQLAILDQYNAAPLIKAGKLRGLAVTGANRSKLVPDLPTYEEAGLQRFEANVWVGVAGPAGMPADLVQKINDVFVKMINTPAIADKVNASFGYDAAPLSPADFKTFIEQQSIVWKDATTTAKVTPQ